MKSLFMFDILIKFLHILVEGNKRTTMIKMLGYFCFHHEKYETFLWCLLYAMILGNGVLKSSKT